MINPNALDLQVLAQMSAASLINAAVVGVGMTVLAWALLRMTQRWNSGTRFAVWFFVLLAVAMLPLFLGATGHAGAAAPAPFTISSSWAIYLLAAWASGSAIGLVRLGFGLWQIFRLRRGCKDVNLTTLDPELRWLFKDAVSSRRVRLCVCDGVKAPAAVGFFRPAILVPSWVLTELSLDELRVTLLHEMAHLRRRDDWTNLIQKVVRAVFFFHPAVWWIEGRLALEREMACDDLVLQQTSSPKAYAASLISFAERVHRGRELALVHAVVGRVKQISYRVRRILDSKRPTATRVWRPVAGLVTVLSGAAMVAGPYTPRLVSFQQAPTAQLASAVHFRPVLENLTIVPIALKETKTKPKAVQAPPKDAMVAPAKLKVRTLPRPRIVLAKGKAEERIQPPDMTMVMRSVAYDAEGSQIWTLCIWRVSDGKYGQQVETMFVVTKI